MVNFYPSTYIILHSDKPLAPMAAPNREHRGQIPGAVMATQQT